MKSEREPAKNERTQLSEALITPDQFQEVILKICDSQTTQDPDHWTEENPLLGQCAVVSLIAQSLFGGKLYRAPLADYPEFAYARSHYVNQLPVGRIVDFTKAQFGKKYPENLTFEEREREYVLSYPETLKRFKLLSIRLAKEITGNALFEDPIYQKCFENAISSSCQKMHFGVVVVKDGIIVAESTNKTIEELKSFCTPTCIRLNIASRAESMLGACGHAEEWALKEIRDKGIDPKECDLYVAGVKMDGMPWIKDKPEHTCLRCAVQMNYAGIKSVQMPVADRWVGITASQALDTAKAYALGEKKIC